MRYSRACLTALATLTLATGITACAVRSPGSASSSGQSDLLTAAELEQWPNGDLFTLIERIRPTWLQTRMPLSTQGSNSIVVVIDRVPQAPGLDLLHGIKVGDVHEVRRLNARDATTLYGTGMTAGAILIVTKH